MDQISYAAAIRTRGLSKDYGEGHGLLDLDLEVERGEVSGFLGPNGAGKSTTIRLLLDLIAPTAGSARLMDLDSRAGSRAIRRRVGCLPGGFALYPRLSGAAMLDYLAELRGGVESRIRDALAERFDADLRRPLGELSTGNRQKRGLIQAFMHEPELLILDEPIAGLDPLVRQSFGFAGTVPRTDELQALHGVREATVNGSHAVVAFEGSADPIVKAIARYEVRSLRSRDDDLEEIFLRHYRGPEDE